MGQADPIRAQRFGVCFGVELGAGAGFGRAWLGFDGVAGLAGAEAGFEGWDGFGFCEGLLLIFLLRKGCAATPRRGE